MHNQTSSIDDVSSAISSEPLLNEIATQPKTWQMPDTLVIIFFVALAAALLTYIIPTGSFQTQEVTYLVDGIEKSRIGVK